MKSFIIKHATFSSAFLFTVLLVALTSSINARADTSAGSGSSSASAGGGQSKASNGHCTATVSNGHATVVCGPQPSKCPSGNTGTSSTEDNQKFSD